MKYVSLVAVALVAVLVGCSTTSNTSQKSDAKAQPEPAARPAAKSDDAKVDTGIIGTARPGSKFANLKLGMQMNAVQDLMGHAPDRIDIHETGKRWIPFYYGADVRRLEALYKGEGCLSFTGGNVWGGAGGELVAIHHDTSGACFQN